MNEDLKRHYAQRFEGDLEAECYDVVTRLDDLTPDRRAFLKTLGGGLLLLVSVRAQGRDVPVRVHVADDGSYRAFTGKMEMGQGARTLLTQAFAEELGVPVGSVHLVMGDTSLCPDDGGTWASLTTPQTVPVIRAAAAAVRAARAGGSSALTPPAEWKTLGQSVRKVNGRAVVTGTITYPSDHRVPGMLEAAIVRAPHHRASLTTFDASRVAGLPGVRVLRDGDLLAVVAPDARRARHAASLIRAEWAPEPLVSQADWPARFKAEAEAAVAQPTARYPPLLTRGDVEPALSAATRRKATSYWADPIAHVPLEPRAAVAVWRDGQVTVHGGSQAPFLARQDVARALGVDESAVRVVSLDAGGAYGGKQRGECESEAARLSRLAGAPVRVAWTREEEFTCGYTRPAGLLEVESGLDASGRIVALRMTNYNSGAAGLTPPYDIANYWIGFRRTPAFVRQGSYRSLAAVANTFARESHLDEWAHDLRVDPVEFRLRHIADARLREVITRTADRFDWGRPRSGGGRGLGMSCTIEKDARLALFVEVVVERETTRVNRLVATGDFGAALNPDALRNQMTGALTQGLGGALWERVVYTGTAQDTRRWSAYRVPRFSDMPSVDVELIDRRDVAPAGAGESPITLVASALAAAMFAATGERRRALPLLTPTR